MTSEESDDPEAPARARGIIRRRELIATVPTVSITEAAARLGCPEAEIARRAARHELLVVPTDDGPRVPTFVFAPEGGILPGLPAVLAALAAVPITSPWSVVDWLVSPVDRDDDRSAVDLLRAGAITEVIEMALTYGQMGR